MRFIEVTGSNGHKIAIPVNKIIGISEVAENNPMSNHKAKTYVATGPEYSDDMESNGWYCQEDYISVLTMLIGVPE